MFFFLITIFLVISLIFYFFRPPNHDKDALETYEYLIEYKFSKDLYKNKAKIPQLGW